MELGWFLFLSGKMKNKWNNPEELEYKIDDIKLLTKVRDDLIKELHLKINIDDINSEIIDNLEKDLKNSKKGNCHLKITIVSNNNGKTLSLDMISREKKISINDNFLKSIENNSSIEYFISK